MYILLLILHVMVCLFLIIVVLLQSGKAADLAGAFGGMGSQTAFGPRGSATLLSKATTASAIVFMITSLSLSILATRGSSSGAKTVLDTPSGGTRTAPAKSPAPAKGPALQLPGAKPGPGRLRPSRPLRRGGRPCTSRAASRCRCRFPAPGRKASQRRPHRRNRRSSAPCGGGGIGRRTSLRC